MTHPIVLRLESLHVARSVLTGALTCSGVTLNTVTTGIRGAAVRYLCVCLYMFVYADVGNVRTRKDDLERA